MHWIWGKGTLAEDHQPKISRGQATKEHLLALSVTLGSVSHPYSLASHPFKPSGAYGPYHCQLSLPAFPRPLASVDALLSASVAYIPLSCRGGEEHEGEGGRKRLD
ncbi:hypothetical protein NL676_038818 [Syzygium grande]|nr:hypothetical protein NL676_038818 [Syzygium grande]